MSETTKKTQKDANVPLQIRVPEVKKKKIKAYAAMQGISTSQLLLDAYEFYRKREK